MLPGLQEPHKLRHHTLTFANAVNTLVSSLNRARSFVSLPASCSMLEVWASRSCANASTQADSLEAWRKASSSGPSSVETASRADYGVPQHHELLVRVTHCPANTNEPRLYLCLGQCDIRLRQFVLEPQRCVSSSRVASLWGTSHSGSTTSPPFRPPSTHDTHLGNLLLFLEASNNRSLCCTL